MTDWLLRKCRSAPLPALMLLLTPWPSMAANGVHPDKIVFGQSACLSGPNRNLGRDYQAGILVAFGERNALGGIDGRSLELMTRDDGYEPEQAVANAERFVAEDDVLAVIGGVGTPTSRRIAPVLRAARIPFVGHVTGAGFLRDAQQYPNVVNLRASYQDEIRVLVKHAVRDHGKRRFGVIYQDDAFGRSGLKGLKVALDEHGLPLLAKAAFSRNTHAVHASLFSLAKADLDVILIVGTYTTNADIINLANSLGHDYIMTNLSFVLSYELKNRVEALSSEILVTEVVPDVNDANSRVVQSFRRALRVAGERTRRSESPAVNEVSLEGYILGRFVIAVLERMDRELTREHFLERALRSGPVSIDDWTVEFQPGTNTGSSYVRLTVFGEYDPTIHERREGP